MPRSATKSRNYKILNYEIETIPEIPAPTGGSGSRNYKILNYEIETVSFRDRTAIIHVVVGTIRYSIMRLKRCVSFLGWI